MTVKKLKISGFKSFAHPTEILIEDGVTGIIGPNGCGKSNVFEAIRWVMGETSSKSLRSGSMDDVIFNGTQSLPAKNIADMSGFYIALTSMIIGVQLFLAGFIAEMISRNSYDRNNYQVEKEV